jgi:hypothetical protein
MAVLRATYGAEETQPPDEPIADRWELVGNDMEKTLWECPAIRVELDKIKGDFRLHEIAKLRRLCDAVADGEGTSDDPAHLESKVDATPEEVIIACAFLDNISATPFLNYIRSKVNGVVSWTVSQWVLRNTKLIANNSTIKPSLLNVGKVYSTEQLRTVELIPATIKFDLAPGFWLKRTPTIEQTAADKWTIVQEWWHGDAYDPLIYEVAT